MKKIALWILLILICLTLILVGRAFYLDKKDDKEMELFNALERELKPNIESYPELKKYYLDLFDKGLIFQNTEGTHENGYKPIGIRIGDARVIGFDCSSKILNLTEDELALGLRKLDNETDSEGYDSLHVIMDEINKIPPIAIVFNEYKADKKITDRELCTLANMYEKGLEYQNNLILRNLNNQTKSEVLQ